MGQIGAANKIIDADQFRWSVLLGRLEELLPEDVAIRTLTPDFKERSLQITAVARDTAAMTALLDALLSSPDMKQAYLLNQSWDEPASGESVVSFSIVDPGGVLMSPVDFLRQLWSGHRCAVERCRPAAAGESRPGIAAQAVSGADRQRAGTAADPASG